MVKVVRLPFLDEASINDILLHNYKLLFMGEVHERPWLVETHRELLANLCRMGRLGFLAVEYFNIEQQSLLDLWMNNKISWKELVEKYQEGPEGFNLDIYRPIFETAKKCDAKIIGVMPPRTTAQLITRKSIIPDTPKEAVPPEDYPPEYECLLRSLLPRAGPMSRIPVEKLILAQSYKDTIASHTIARSFKEYGSGAVIMGWVHVEAKGGVATRVSRLTEGPLFLVVGAREGGEWRNSINNMVECLETSYLLIRE